MPSNVQDLRAQIDRTRSEITTLESAYETLGNMRVSLVQDLATETNDLQRQKLNNRIHSIDHGYRWDPSTGDLRPEYRFWQPLGFIGRLHIPARVQTLKETLSGLQAMLPTDEETAKATLRRKCCDSALAFVQRRREAHLSRFRALLRLAAHEARTIVALSNEGNAHYHKANEITDGWGLPGAGAKRSRAQQPFGAAWNDDAGLATTLYIKLVAEGRAEMATVPPLPTAEELEIVLETADAKIADLHREFTGEDTIPPPSIATVPTVPKIAQAATGTPGKNLSKIQANA